MCGTSLLDPLYRVRDPAQSCFNHKLETAASLSLARETCGGDMLKLGDQSALGSRRLRAFRALDRLYLAWTMVRPSPA